MDGIRSSSEMLNIPSIKKRSPLDLGHLSIAEKQCIINMYKQIITEKIETKTTYIVSKIVETLGFAKSTVYRTIKEYRLTGNVTPPKRSGGRPAIVTTFDEYTENSLRQIVHSFFFKNENPTLDKILSELHSRPDLPKMSRSTLYQFMKHINSKNKESTTGSDNSPDAFSDSDLDNSRPTSSSLGQNEQGPPSKKQKVALRTYGSKVPDTNIKAEPQDAASTEDPLLPKIEGNRITSIQYVFDAMKKLSNHNPTRRCSFNNLNITSEELLGLNSDLNIHCNNCMHNFKLSLINPSCKSYDLNGSLLSDEVVKKLGHSGVENMLESVELPPISLEQYNDVISVGNVKKENEVFIKEEIDIDEHSFDTE